MPQHDDPFPADTPPHPLPRGVHLAVVLVLAQQDNPRVDPARLGPDFLLGDREAQAHPAYSVLAHEALIDAWLAQDGTEGFRGYGARAR